MKKLMLMTLIACALANYGLVLFANEEQTEEKCGCGSNKPKEGETTPSES